ncbi:MAG: hypothetical protein Q9195_008838 [Heterodermia aff. obscurata]
MALVTGLNELQDLLAYRFENISLLMLALTAAGADDKVYDGNRKMAQLGEKLMELLLAENAFSAGNSRAHVNEKITTVVTRRSCEEVAKATGITRFIRYNPRQGNSPPSPAVLSLAVRAIVCACWLDSDQSNVVARRVMWRLGFAISEEPCIDPTKLSINQQPHFVADSHSIGILSNEQAKNPAGNDDCLAIYQALVPDELNDYSEIDTVDQASCIESQGHGDLVPNDSNETRIGQEALVQDGQSTIQPEGTREPISPISVQQEMVSSLDINPNSLFSDGTNATVIWQELRPARRSTEDLSTAVELGDTIMHEQTSSENDGDSPSSPSQHQATTRERRLETARRPKHTSVPNVTQSSRYRKTEPATTRSSSTQSRISYKGSFLEKRKALLEEYILQHRAKYENLGLTYPGDHFDTEDTRKHLASLGLENHADILKVFSCTIGGHESLIGIKEILRAYRNPEIGSLQTPREVSNAKRLQIIQSLERNEAYMNFLKKCHIHQLYMDNIDPLENSYDNFVVRTTTSRANRKQTGNPQNAAESRVAISMVMEVYPDVQLNSSAYKQKYREITLLRRSGRRLALLVSHFGRGILGLLPLTQDESSCGFIYKNLEALMSRLSDSEFKKVVWLLNRFEGDLLRKVCAVITPIVEEIFYGSGDLNTRFFIEDVELDQIMQYPRNSPHILQLFSRIPPPNE